VTLRSRGDDGLARCGLLPAGVLRPDVDVDELAPVLGALAGDHALGEPLGALHVHPAVLARHGLDPAVAADPVGHDLTERRPLHPAMDDVVADRLGLREALVPVQRVEVARTGAVQHELGAVGGLGERGQLVAHLDVVELRHLSLPQ